MAAYVKSHPLSTNFGGGSPTIVQSAFLSSDAVGQTLNLSGGVVGLRSSLSSQSHQLSQMASQAASQAQSAPAKPTDAKMVGLVVLHGTFVWPPATSSSTPPTSPYAYEIFDAKTGNLIMYGGLVQPPSTQPNATPTPTSPPTGEPTPTLTPTPRLQPTPTFTATSTPCPPFVNGSGSMNVDLVYLNVDLPGSTTSPFNPGNLPAGAHVQWITTPAPGMMAPSNGAQFADMGPIGATGFSNLTCAQIKLAAYGVPSVPAVDMEVFLVKTAGGHYAKVLISILPGNPNPTLRWQTYS